MNRYVPVKTTKHQYGIYSGRLRLAGPGVPAAGGTCPPAVFALPKRPDARGGGYQDTGWHNFFVDPQVAGLITEALKNNRDLKIAALKVEEARAQFNVTDADRYPQLNASSGITYSGGLKSDKPTAQQYDAGLMLSYELDFFGKLKNMSEADRQNYFASEEARRAVHILLVSNVSQSYFNQQLAYKQLRIAQDTLNNYRQSYAFVEQQLVTGSTNVLALEQARGQIENTQAEIAKREGELAQANNALQLVLGTYRALPGDGGMNASDVVPVKLPPHLSSEILLQRPDIMEAEYQLKAADANIGAARAAFFPSISLTSGLSTGSTELSSLFTSGSGMWNFIPKIEIPIFNAGRNKANLKLAEIRLQQSVVNYEQKFSPPLNRLPTRSRCGTALTSSLLHNSGIWIRSASRFNVPEGYIPAARSAISRCLTRSVLFSLPSKIFSTLFMPGRLMKLISSPRSAAVGSNNLI